MGIEFNPVSEVKDPTFVGRIALTIQKGLGQIFVAKTSDCGVGVTVESPRLAQLEAHFAGVSDSVEYNDTETQLVIIGPLMGGDIEETAEI